MNDPIGRRLPGTAQSRNRTGRPEERGVQNPHRANENRRAGRSATAGKHATKTQNAGRTARASLSNLRPGTCSGFTIRRPPWHAAAERFGNPDELAEQLQAALPFHERIDFSVEALVRLAAPESVARYALRQSALAFGILATVFPLLFVGIILRYGWFPDVWTLIRVLTSVMLLTPPVQFVFTFAWIKMRDSLWGVFGSRKSLVRALFYDAAIAVVVMLAFVSFAWAATLESWRGNCLGASRHNRGRRCRRYNIHHFPLDRPSNNPRYSLGNVGYRTPRRKPLQRTDGWRLVRGHWRRFGARICAFVA